MFTVEERDLVRNRLVQMSRSDPRLVGGALIGSTASGSGAALRASGRHHPERWSRPVVRRRKLHAVGASLSAINGC